MSMRVCLMVEGQEGVSWEDWLALGAACEQNGYEGLFRSDHYAPITGSPTYESLDAWTTLAGLAATTSRIRLGTMVSPVTFRHPSLISKAVTTVDHISGGRAELGLGAGWYDADHTRFGFEFPDDRTRMQLLAEQLEIVHRQWTESSFSFQGRHYRLEDCTTEPKPVQQPHPPVIMGGGAGPVSSRLAALWADEYNTYGVSAVECARRRARVAEAFDRHGRDPDALRFSLMTGTLVGADGDDLERRILRTLELRGQSGSSAEFLREVGDRWIIGTLHQVVDRLGELSEAGVDRVMLQLQDHRDLDMVALVGQEVLPELR